MPQRTVFFVLAWVTLCLMASIDSIEALTGGKAVHEPEATTLLMNNGSSSEKIYCKDVNKHNASEQCYFVGNTSDCAIAGGFISYLDLPYCTLSQRWQPVAMILLFLWLLYLFLAIGVTVEHFLCPALAVISNTLGLSESVAGVTFLAFGNGAADIFSIFVLITTGDGDPVRAETGMGAILGGGLFVTSIVVGLIAFNYPLHVKMPTFLRDVSFYLVAICWLIGMLSDGRISRFEALGYVILYIVYVSSVILMLKVSQHLEKRRVSFANTERTPLLDGRSQRQYRSKERKETAESHSKSQLMDNSLSSSFTTVRFTGSIAGGSIDWRLASDGSVLPPDTMSGDEDAEEGKASTSPTDGKPNTSSVSTDGSKAASPHQPAMDTSPANMIKASAALISADEIAKEAGGVVDDKLGDPPSNTGDQSEAVLPSDSEDDDFVTTGDSLLHRSISITIPDSPMRKFLNGLWPYSALDFKTLNWLGRIMLLLRVPIRFVLTISVPVILPTTSVDEAEKTWNKYLICLSCLIAPIFATLALDVFFHAVKDGHVVIFGMIACAIGIIFCVATVIFTRYHHPPRGKPIFAFLGFLISVVWIYLIANEVVNILDTVGVVLELNGAFLGLIVLSGGNSVCDLVANFLVAKSGKAEMAVAACYGSPLLNMLIGVGLSATIATFRDGEHYAVNYTSQLKVASGALLGGLVFAACFLVISNRTCGWKAGRLFAIPLFCMYIAFLGAEIALEFS